MLDSIYQRTLKLLKNHVFGMKMSRFLPSFTQYHNESHYVMTVMLLKNSEYDQGTPQSQTADNPVAL